MVANIIAVVPVLLLSPPPDAVGTVGRPQNREAMVHTIACVVPAGAWAVAKRAATPKSKRLRRVAAWLVKYPGAVFGRSLFKVLRPILRGAQAFSRGAGTVAFATCTAAWTAASVPWIAGGLSKSADNVHTISGGYEEYAIGMDEVKKLLYNDGRWPPPVDPRNESGNVGASPPPVPDLPPSSWTY